MQVTKEFTSPTTIKLTVAAENEELNATKQFVVKRLAKDVKMQGFRPGKAPLELVEKNIDSSLLQTEFLEQAVNELYVRSIDQERIRPVAQPEISISKFVPFSTLEFTAIVEAVGEIKLGNYKKLSVTKPATKISEKQIDDVIKDLQLRVAKKEDVTRAANKDDEVTIPVQVNGKVRGTVTLAADSIEEEVVVAEAKKDPKISSYIGDKTAKVIYVKGKILNFIVQ